MVDPSLLELNMQKSRIHLNYTGNFKGKKQYSHPFWEYHGLSVHCLPIMFMNITFVLPSTWK